MVKKNLLPFILFWLLDSLILYLAVLVFPKHLVLGSKMVTGWAAAFVAGFTWTLIVWLLKPLVLHFTKTKGKLFLFGFYLVLNFVALWLTARLGPIVGFGTTRFVWLIPMAVAADIIQSLALKP